MNGTGLDLFEKNVESIELLRDFTVDSLQKLDAIVPHQFCSLLLEQDLSAYNDYALVNLILMVNEPEWFLEYFEITTDSLTSLEMNIAESYGLYGTLP